MKELRILLAILFVALVSSCAQPGPYFQEDKLSTRYGVICGDQWPSTQTNRSGRGNSGFQEPKPNLIKALRATSKGMKEINSPWLPNVGKSVWALNYIESHTHDDLLHPKRSRKSISDLVDELPTVLQRNCKNNEYDRNTEDVMVHDQIVIILNLQRRLKSDYFRKSGEKRLAELKSYYDKSYVHSIQRKLCFLQNLYNRVYNTMSIMEFDRYKMSVPACEDSLSQKLQKKLRDKKKEFAKDNSYFYICQSLTDGKLYDKDDYTFTYLHGDPSKVEDKKLAKLMFGNTSHQVSGSKYLENLIKRDEKYASLNQYKILFSENKWFRVSMGSTKVYLQVATVGNEEQIIGIINPSRGIYIVG